MYIEERWLWFVAGCVVGLLWSVLCYGFGIWS